MSVTVAPTAQLGPLVAEAPGALGAVRGVAHVARLPLHVAERMASSASRLLADRVPVQVETKVLDEREAVGTGGAMVLVADTDGGPLGAATVAERGVPAERLGEATGRALRAEIDAGAAVDVHAADQLLIYAALARGTSRLAARSLSRHAETVIWLLEQFLPVRFRVDRGGGLARINVLHAPPARL